MRLKVYILIDPRTKKVEQVYEYPSCLASPGLLRPNSILVSREPLRIPILVVPKEYLEEKSGELESSETIYGDFDLYDYWYGLKKEEHEAAVVNNKIEQLQTMFSSPIPSLYSCKTIFFTGPKEIYKQTFNDHWVYDTAGRFILVNIGLFRTIEDLSFKGPNDIFIKGTFEFGDTVKPDTQCKITFHRK